MADQAASAWLAVGQILRSAREAMGLQRYQLAVKAGLHASTIGRLERGLHPPERRTLTAAVTALRPGLESTGALGDLVSRLASHGVDVTAVVGDETTLVDHRDHRATAGGDETTWEILYERAIRLDHLAADHEEAIRVLKLALRHARNDAQRAAALAEEANARWRLAEDGFESSLSKCRQAVAALDLDWTQVEPGTGRLPLGALDRLSDLGLTTYAVTIVHMGVVLFERTQIPQAEHAFATARVIGELLGNQDVGYGTRHFSMLCGFSRATRPTVAGDWECIDRRRLAQAERYFQRPNLSTPGPIQHVGMAHDARWQGRIQVLAGDLGAALRAYDRAEAVFGHHADRAHVWRDRGLLALRRDDLRASRAHLLAALDGAWAMKYPQLVADALRGLGYLAAVTGTRTGRRQALDSAVCAVLAHPVYLDRAEGRETIGFAADLVDSLADDAARLWRLYRREMEDAIYSARPPFNYLIGLHTSDPIKPGVLERVWKAIDVQLAGRA